MAERAAGRRWFAPTLIGALSLGALATWALWPEAPAPPMESQGAPVIYTSLEELLAATDTTVIVDVVSEPVGYLDYGGEIDYEGEVGVAVELVKVEVLEVLRGDSALVGTTLSVAQPPAVPPVWDEARPMDRLVSGSRVLIVGSTIQANLGVGEEGEVLLTPAPRGRGVYDVLPEGAVVPRESRYEWVYPAGVPIDPAVFAAAS